MLPMSKNSTFFFLIDNFSENTGCLFNPTVLDQEFEEMVSTLPLMSPSSESIQKIMQYIDSDF
jgi:hypothetical protein